MEKIFQLSPQEAITRRELFGRAKKVAMGAGATWALWNIEARLASSQEKSPEQSIRERITNEDKDIVFFLGTRDNMTQPQSSQEDMLIIIDWQEKFVGERVNKNADVREQLRLTEEKMIERIQEAKRKNIPVVAFGLSDAKREAIKGRLLASEDFLEENYSRGVRDALEGYERAHYLAKQDNSIVGKANKKQTIETFQTILRDNNVKNVRLMGANESICVKWSAQDMLYTEDTGDSFTVIVNPAELADSEEIIKKYNAREIYETLPRRTLFLKLANDYNRLRDEGKTKQEAIDNVVHSRAQVVIEVFDKKEGKGSVRTIITPEQMDELKKFLENGILPEYF